MAELVASGQAVEEDGGRQASEIGGGDERHEGQDVELGVAGPFGVHAAILAVDRGGEMEAAGKILGSAERDPFGR